MSKYKILPIFIPFQGCPGKCIFCDQNIISGKNIKNFESDILQQLEFYKKNTTKWDEIAFYGGSFNFLPNEKRTFLYKLAKQKNIDHIRISAYPINFDCNFVNELKNKNVKTVELGIQSFSNNVLKINGRFYTKNDILKTINLLDSSGLNIGLQLMVGMYGESLDDVLFNFKYLLQLRYKYLRIYPTVVLKDTKLAELLNENDPLNFSFDEVIAISTIYFISAIKKGVTVLRMGLHNQHNIQKHIIGGYFHPSFGDIVKTFVIFLYCKTNTKNPLLFKNFPNYNGIITRKWDIAYSDDINFRIIVEKLWEKYIENNRWYTERTLFKIAKEFWYKANNR